MLLKFTIISAIVSVVLFLVNDVIAKNLDALERFYIQIHEPPAKVMIMGVLTILSFIATVVLAIITIITW